MIEPLKLRLRGVEPLDSLAAKIVGAMEIRHWKINLGYSGMGVHQAYRGEERPTWENLLRKQANISDAAEIYYAHCVAAVKARLANLGTTEATEILALIESGPPSALSDDERERLVDGIRRLALRKGDSTKVLRCESWALNGKGDVATPAEDVFEPEVVVIRPGDLLPAVRAANPFCLDYDPASRRRHLITLGLHLGCQPKRANELAIMMTPDEELSADEQLWKSQRKSMAMEWSKLVRTKNENP